MTNPNVATVRLVDQKTRVVEVLGPKPAGSRWPTDRELGFWRPQANHAEFSAGPQRVGTCILGDGRKARFLVDKGPTGDGLLDLLARHPKAQVRPARPWGPKGYLVEG